MESSKELEFSRLLLVSMDQEKLVEFHLLTQKNKYCILIHIESFQKQNYRLRHREKNYIHVISILMIAAYISLNISAFLLSIHIVIYIGLI